VTSKSWGAAMSGLAKKCGGLGWFKEALGYGYQAV